MSATPCLKRCLSQPTTSSRASRSIAFKPVRHTSRSRGLRLCAYNSASADSNPAPDASQPDQQQSKPGAMAKIKRFFLGDKVDKAQLAALGMGAFAAYGVLSNLNAGVLMTISWITVVKQTGMTPLEAGQWTRFLAIYAGLYVSSNFLRPIRLSLALGAAASFDRVIGAIQKKTGFAKPVAFGIMLMCIAATTITCLITAIWLFGGFPQGFPLSSPQRP
jgi:hypothetical protein